MGNPTLFHCGFGDVVERRLTDAAAAAHAIPTPFIRTLLDPLAETGIRPLVRARNQFVANRIEMDVIKMATEIALVADGMLPKLALPYAASAMAAVGFARGLLPSGGSQPALSERLLEVRPADRETMIVLGERPDRVKMIRENHDRVDGEGPSPLGFRKR